MMEKLKTGYQVVSDAVNNVTKADQLDKKEFAIHTGIVFFFAILAYAISYLQTIPQTPMVALGITLGTLAIRYYEDVYKKQNPDTN